METENDSRMLYLTIGLVVGELCFFFGLMIDKYWFLGIPLDVCAMIVIYAVVYISSIKEGTAHDWLKIDVVGESQHELEGDDEGCWFSIDGKPELVQISEPEVKAILQSDEIIEHATQIKDKIDALYSLEPVVQSIEKRDGNSVACTIELREDHVDFFKYSLDYFKLRQLESHLPRNIVRFIYREMGYKIWISKDQAAKTFAALDPVAIKRLRSNIRERFHKDLNLQAVQEYLKLKFENWFFPKEIEFFNKRGITNFGQLLEKDVHALGKQFNMEFKRRTDFNLPKFVAALKGEVVRNMSILLQTFSDTGLAQFVKLNEVPLFMVHYDYYFYRVRFKNRKWEVPIRETEKTGTKIRTSSVILMMPRLWGDAIRNRPREMYFNGIPIMVPQTEKIQVAYIRMLLSGLPVYFVNDCSYLRDRNKAKLDIETEKVLKGFIDTLSFLYRKKMDDVQKTKTLYTDAQATIESQQETIDDLVASDTEKENVGEEFKRMRDMVKARTIPTKTELPIFWFLLIVILIAGVFVGMNWPW